MTNILQQFITYVIKNYRNLYSCYPGATRIKNSDISLNDELLEKDTLQNIKILNK